MFNLTTSVVKKIEEIYDIKVDTDKIMGITKDDNTERVKSELRPLINEEFYNIFKVGIETGQSLLLKDEDLNRLSNKTVTMVYLALEYDLPLLVATSVQARALKDKYEHTNLRVHSSLSENNVGSPTILLDQGSLEKAKEENGNRIYVGIKM